MKKFQYCQRSSIQWLYLCHPFLQAYFASHKPTIKSNEPSSSKTQSQILSYVDFIEAFADELSKEIDYELNIFREHNNAFLRNNDNCTSQYHPFVHKTSKTSNRPKTNSSNSGLPTHHVPQVYIEHTTLPISLLHLHGEEDPGTPCESSIFSWSFTNTTTPLLPPTDKHTVVTQAHLAMRTTPNNLYNPMNPYATTIDTQNKRFNMPRFIPEMPEDCGVDHETLMLTFLLMHHLSCPNLNTSLITCANRMSVPG
jgi:hypothetical protein